MNNELEVILKEAVVIYL